MSNSRDDAGAIDYLEENEQPSPELLAVHRRLEADGANWRRTLPSADPLLQWAMHGGMSLRASASADENSFVKTGNSNDAPALNGSHGRVPRANSRMQGVAALSVALVVVLLFGLLLHFITGTHPAISVSTPTAIATAVVTSSATAAITGRWTALSGLTLTGLSSSVTGQAGVVAIAPSDPQVVYEAMQSPPSLRRTSNNGASWQKLSLPVNTANAQVVEVYLSPVDENNVFLTLTAFKAVGDLTPCDNQSLTYGREHGGILASGSAACSLTYHSTDGGAHWKVLTLPVPGVISEGSPGALAVSVNPIQAQGSLLYALVNCGEVCTYTTETLIRSSDNGATWQRVELPQNNVCTFAVTPDRATIFAATNTDGCGIGESKASISSLWRSDDGGINWRANGQTPNNSLVGMAVTEDPGSGQPILYVMSPPVQQQGHGSSYQFDATSIYASGNGGAKWTQAPSNSASPALGQPGGQRAPRMFAQADGSITMAFVDAQTSTATTLLYGWRAGQKIWYVASKPLEAQAQADVFLNVAGSYWGTVVVDDSNSATTRVYKLSA